MNKQFGLKTFGILAALAVLFLAAMACTFTGDPRQGGTLEFTLTEDNINELLERSRNDGNSNDLLLEEYTGVDIKDGQIQVFGTYTDDNGATQEGSYTVTMAAEDGALVVEVVDVDIDDMAMDDPRVQRANDELADALSKSAAQNRGEVEFTSVEVKDGEVDFQIKFDWDQK